MARQLLTLSVILALACAAGGRVRDAVVEGMPAALLGEWKALGPPSETMVVGKETITYPDFPELDFRFRIVRQSAGVVELENTSYDPEKNGSFPYWRLEAAGTFLHRPALNASYGFRVKSGHPEYENTTAYLRPDEDPAGARARVPDGRSAP